MASTPFPTSLLVLCLGLLLCLSFVCADTHVTCDKSIENNSNFTWWNNKQNNNPCMVLQTLLQQCDPSHTIHLMPASPLQPPDICQSGAAGTSGGEKDFIPCCCNTAAYALRQACWSCQQGAENPRKPDRRPTFREYLQCPKSVDKKQFKAAHVPKWAFTPIDPDATWDFDDTRALVIMSSKKSMVSMPDSDDGDDSSHHRNGGNNGKGNNNGTTSQQTSAPMPENSMQGPMAVAIAGGVLAGLAAVASVLAVVICIKRRRQRKERAMMPTWYANGAYASPVRSSTAGIDLEGPPPVIVMPPPSLTRGRVALTPMSAASWSSSLAREPLIPRAGSTLEPDEMMYARARAPVVSMSKTHSFSI